MKSIFRFASAPIAAIAILFFYFADLPAPRSHYPPRALPAYPNPTSAFLYINDRYEFVIETVIVQDLKGLMYTCPWNKEPKRVQVDVRSLAPGFYTAALKINGHLEFYSKFLKQ